MANAPAQPTFNRPPRIIRPLPRDEVEIPAPPPPPNTSMSQPLAMILLPTMTGVFYLIVVLARGNQGGNLWLSLPIVLISFVSAGIGWWNYREQQRRNEAAQRAYQNMYAEVVQRVRKRLEHLTEEQRRIYRATYPDPRAVIDIVKPDQFDALPETRLWERRPDDDDFLFLRIGIGSVPTSLQLKTPRINEFQFSPQLKELIQLAEDFATVKDVPIALPLPQLGAVGIASSADKKRIEFAYWLIWQVAVHHAPQDVRLAVFWDRADDQFWSWLRRLPHTRPFDDDSYRLLARYNGDPDHLQQVAAVLQRELQQRSEYGLQHRPRIVVVLDQYDTFANAHPVFDAIIERGRALGMYTLCLVPETRLTPSAAGGYVDLDRGRLAIAGKEGGERQFTPDYAARQDCDDLSRKLASLGDQMDVSSGELPRSVRFSELLKLGDLKTFDPNATWQDPAEPNKSWNKVEVGRDGPESPLFIDLNEGVHGVHGIIAGTTGSGKSEFLLTFLMALAVRHSPDRLNLLLIDFKGGATFKDIAGLPHTAGMVTDLSGNEAERALIAMNSELDRRKRRLQETGCANIREYRRLQQRRPELPPMPNLMIAIDEFDEMMRDFPAFSDELIRVAKQGRSLGVHLLFATQQPSLVKEGLTRNLTYRIALRLTSTDDSKTLLGIPDAAYLTTDTPGRGYFRVNKDVQQFQSARITLPYQPPLSGSGLSEIDATGRCRVENTRIEQFLHSLIAQWERAVDIETLERLIIDEFRKLIPRDLTEQERQTVAKRLLQVRNPDGLRETVRSLFEQIQRTVDTELSLIVTAMQQRRPANYAAQRYRVWTAPLPSLLPSHRLPSAVTNAWMQVPLGLLDYPAQAEQRPLRYNPLGADGNLLIVGAAQSGKTTALRALMLGLAARYGPDQLWIYTIDPTGRGCGLRNPDQAGLPHIADAITPQEDQRLERLRIELEDMLDARRDLLRRYGAENLLDYWRRCQHTPSLPPPPPVVLVVIDGVSALADEYSQALIAFLRDARPYGIIAAITGATHKEVQQWLNVCETRIVLRVNDQNDSDQLLGKKFAAQIPPNLPGRGFWRSTEGPVEVQIALPMASELPPDQATDAESFVDPVDEAKALVEQIRDRYAGAPAPAPLRLPETYIDLDTLLAEVAAPAAPFARDTLTFKPLVFDLDDTMPHLLIAGGPASGKSAALQTLLTTIAARSHPEEVQFALIDYRKRTLAPFANSPFGRDWLVTVPDPVPVPPNPPTNRQNWKGEAETIRMAVSDGQAAGLCIALYDELRNRVQHGRSQPRLFLVVNDLDLMIGQEAYYLGLLSGFAMRGDDIGFHIIITATEFNASNQLVKAMLAQRCALYLGKPSDPSKLTSIGVNWSKKWEKVPFPPGRGLLRLPDRQLMVQVAHATDATIKRFVTSLAPAGASQYNGHSGAVTDGAAPTTASNDIA